MRLVTFETDGERRLGARRGEGIVDLCRADPSLPPDLRRLLEAGPAALRAAEKALDGAQDTIDAEEVRIVAPISDPGKVVCIGLNYADHASETKMAVPSEPVVFAKYTSAIIGPGDAITLPATSEKVDYEAELVAVIGTGGRDIPESQALDHVAGYTVGNDVSARDYQLEKPGGQWLMGKTFDTFAPIGPDVVTADEVPDPHSLKIRCILNGTTMQDSCTDRLIFGVDKLVAYLSHVVTLAPGDIIFTGTPPGVGMARTPPVWLRSGDRVTCEVDGVGRLENPVV
jgi:2-keto-4-pentenoate hydratase/2-oxohepta-3-ene-1,7-dioic acid hydratase in catechol pathway